MSGTPRNVNARIGLDPSAYVAGSDKVSWATKRMLAQQEAADRKWRALQGAHQAALDEEARRQQAVADAAAAAEQQKQDAYTKTGKVLLAGSAALAAGLAVSAKAAIDWESAWTGVVKTTDATAEQLPALEKNLRSLARSLPSSHEEIAAVAEAAGQLGVKSKDVVSFTKVMIDLGQSTNLTADEASTSLAQMMNIMQTAPADVSRLGATLVALGNNGASTEADIMAMALRLSGAGKTIHLTEANVLSLANAMASVGISAEAGGSAMSRTMTMIATAVSGGGRQLQAFAQTAGMSADEFAAKFKTAPAQAIDAVVQGLGRVSDSGGDVFGTLSGLGIKSVEMRDTLLRLAGSGDLLSQSLKDGDQAWKDNTALVNEANKRYGTTASKMAIAKNEVNDFAISIGETFLPVIADMADSFSDVVDWLNRLPGPVKTGVAILAALVAGVGAAGGAFLILAPRLAAARAELVLLQTTAPRLATTLTATGKAVGFLGKAAAKAAPVLAVLMAGGSLVKWGSDIKTSVSGVTSDLLALADGTKSADDAFDGLKAKKGTFKSWLMGNDVDSLKKAMDVLMRPDADQQFDNVISSVITLGSATSASRTQAQKMFDGIDEGLASLVQSGAANKAKAALDQLGIPLEYQAELLPKYNDALTDMANAQKTAGTATDGGTAALDSQAAAANATSEEYKAALDAYNDLIDTWSKAAATFVDVGGTYTSMYTEQQEAAEAAAQKTAEQKGLEGDAWKDFVSDVRVSLDQYLAELQRQVDAQTNWQQNLLTLTGKVSDETMQYLIGLGKDGAPLVQQLVDGTAKQLQRFDDLTQKSGTGAASSWAASFDQAMALIDAVAATKGPKAAEKLRTALSKGMQDGTIDVAKAAKQLGATITQNLPGQYEVTFDADTKPAKKKFDDVLGLFATTPPLSFDVGANTGPARQDIADAKSDVDGTTGTMKIDANTWPGKQSAQSLKDYVNQSNPFMKVGADTSSARSAINGVLSLANQAATIVLNAGKGGANKATGGAITGPGTGTSDDVPIMASNGEHMWTAAEVKKAGGQGAMYRMRAAVRSGMLHLATGGAVVKSYRGHSLEYWQQRYASGSDYLRLQQKIKDDKASLAAKELYGPKDKHGKQHEKRYVLRGIDRRVANAELREDKRALSDANIARAFVKKYGSFAAAIRARDTAKDKADAAAEKKKSDTAAAKKAASDFASAGSELKTDIRRGDVAEAIAGGLSSALGVTDRAREEAKSSTLSKKQKKAINDAANAAEKSLTSLYGKADKLQGALDKAKTHLADMQQIADAASGTIKGTFNLSAAYNASGTMKTDKYGNTWYDTSTQGYTGSAIKATAAKQATTARSFAAALETLQKRLGSSPASAAIVQQALSIFASDPDQGLQFVAALNSMSTADLGAVKSSYNTIASAGTSVGQSASAADTAGGLSAANKAATDLATSLDNVNKQIAGVGTSLTNAMLKPYGLKLDKNGNVVKRAAGGAITGPGTGTSDDVPIMASNGEHMWTAAEVKAVGGQGAMYRLRAAVRSGLVHLTGGGAVPVRQPAYVQPANQPASSAQSVTVEMPRELVVVDADGHLVGRMKVEAGRVVAAYDTEQARTAEYANVGGL